MNKKPSDRAKKMVEAFLATIDPSELDPARIAKITEDLKHLLATGEKIGEDLMAISASEIADLDPLIKDLIERSQADHSIYPPKMRKTDQATGESKDLSCSGNYKNLIEILRKDNQLEAAILGMLIIIDAAIIYRQRGVNLLERCIMASSAEEFTDSSQLLIQQVTKGLYKMPIEALENRAHIASYYADCIGATIDKKPLPDPRMYDPDQVN